MMLSRPLCIATVVRQRVRSTTQVIVPLVVPLIVVFGIPALTGCGGSSLSVSGQDNKQDKQHGEQQGQQHSEQRVQGQADAPGVRGSDDGVTGAAGASPTADSVASDAFAERAEARQDAAVEPPGPRLGVVSYFAWVYKNPSRKGQPIGFLRPGTTVALKTAEPTSGADCPSKRWMQIEPPGYVCDDGAVTTDVDSALFRALQDAVTAGKGNDWQRYRFAYSTGAPMYGRFPTTQERQREVAAFGSTVGQAAEQASGKRRFTTSYEELATSEAVTATDAVPSYALPELPRLRGYDAGLIRKRIPAGSLLSFSKAVEHNGNVFLLSPDLTWVPADRVKPFATSSFRGVALGQGIALPLAWTRREPRTKYREAASGVGAERAFEPTDASWPARTAVPLTGMTRQVGRQLYWETREPGMWVREQDVSIVKEKTELPASIGADQKWIEVSTGRGTLTLYVGHKAVFSTLASPGRGGGAGRAGMSIDELVQASQTPLGTYRVTYKVDSSIMTPEGTPFPKKHWIQDVPYALYFMRPFAIHGAYWHEDFGMPKSGGCINLSPADAKHVFDWAEPSLPKDWAGVASGTMGLGTPVVIRR